MIYSNFFKFFYFGKKHRGMFFAPGGAAEKTGGFLAAPLGRGGECHHGAPRGVGGMPKMRHLVLYKLAGFSRSDYVP